MNTLDETLCQACHANSGAPYTVYFGKTTSSQSWENTRDHIVSSRTTYSDISAQITPICDACITKEQGRLRRRFVAGAIIYGLLIAIGIGLTILSYAQEQGLIWYALGALVCAILLIWALAKYLSARKPQTCGARLAVQARKSELQGAGYDAVWTQEEHAWLAVSQPLTLSIGGTPMPFAGVSRHFCAVCGTRVTAFNRPTNFSGRCGDCETGLPKRYLKYFEEYQPDEDSLVDHRILSHARPYIIYASVIFAALMASFVAARSINTADRLLVGLAIGIIAVVFTATTFHVVLFYTAKHPLDIKRLALFFVSSLLAFTWVCVPPAILYMLGKLPASITGSESVVVSLMFSLALTLAAVGVGLLAIWITEKKRKKLILQWLGRWRAMKAAVTAVPVYSAAEAVPVYEIPPGG